MSDFRLKEIALLAGKDSRTIREWCKKGLIEGAYLRGGAGSHWRIRATSALAAAEQAAKAAEGFARNRGKRWESSLRGFAQVAAKMRRRTLKATSPVMEFNRTAWKLARKLRPAGRPAACCCQILLEVSDDRLERIGWSRQMLEKLRDQIMPRTTANELIRSALLIVMLEEFEESHTEPKRARAAISRRIGVDRRTFNRDYGRFWDSAAASFDRMTGGENTMVAGYVTSRRGDECGEVGLIAFHESATDDDLRAWRSGVKQSVKSVD